MYDCYMFIFIHLNLYDQVINSDIFPIDCVNQNQYKLLGYNSNFFNNSTITPTDYIGLHGLIIVLVIVFHSVNGKMTHKKCTGLPNYQKMYFLVVNSTSLIIIITFIYYI